MASLKPIVVEYPFPNAVRIILNRPKSLNALNAEMLRLLVDVLREHQTNTRVMILEGAGDRSFCSGEDLKETLAPRTGSAEELRAAFLQLQDLTRLTSSAPAIVVAVVHGFAIGGGAELALAADFVIGSPKASFKFPEASIGHAVTGGISLRLTQLVGLLRAKELLLRGRFVYADEALKIGLLTEVVDDPKARAVELAKELTSFPAVSMSNSKTSLERAVFPNMESTLQDEVNVASYCFAQQDATSAFSNFATRKPPQSRVPLLAESASTAARENEKPVALGANKAGHLMEDVADLNTALRRARGLYGPKVFIRFGGQDTSFDDFDKSVARLAGGLRESGIIAGDRVLVMMRNSLEMVHSWFATNRLGAIWVPVNTELKSITLQHVIDSAEAKVALVDVEFQSEIERISRFPSDKIFVKDPEGGPTDFLALYEPREIVDVAVDVKPSTVSAFLYTSGTTGRSKPCILSHQYFVLQALALVQSFGLNSDDVLYCPFPLFHADATALTVVPALLLGATAALSVRFSASKFWTEVRAMEATVYDFMGATLALVHKQPPSPHDKDHKIRFAWGVPIPAFAEDYERRFNHPLYTLYGSVEASLPVIQPIDRPRVPGSCGVVRPGYTVRIAAEFDEALPVNTAGNLLLRADQPNAFFHGYFNAPSDTIAAFRNLWFHTGDIARIDENGNVYFHGRLKDVIRRRGENVNATEVEEELLQHPDVLMAAAYGIPSSLADGDGTEEDVKVAVVLKDGSTVEEKSIWEWSVRNMARFQVPSVIQIVPQINRTPTGKIVKSGLKVEGGTRFDIREAK